MADFYLKSGSATERINATAYALGAKIVIARADVTANYLVVRKWVLECTTAGTTGAAVPAWPATVTQDTTTVTDGTAVFTFRKPGFSSGATAGWLFSAIYADYVATAMAAGDRLFISNNHAESIASTVTIAFPGTLTSPVQALCVVDTAAPPTTLSTTGSITTTGQSNLFVAGSAYIHGVIFNCATGSGSAYLVMNQTEGHYQVLRSCQLNLVSTDTGSSIASIGGNANVSGKTDLINCAVTLGRSDFQLFGLGLNTHISGGSLSKSTFSDTALSPFGSSGEGAVILIEGYDFSGLNAAVKLVIGGGSSNPGLAYIKNCKLPASWTGTLVNSRITRAGSRVEMHNCDSVDTNYRLWIEEIAGSIRSETTIVKTGGASDGTTALSWKMATSLDTEYPWLSLNTMDYAEWIETLVAKTVTFEIIHDSAANLKDDEVWLEVSYLGTAGFPLGTTISDAKSSVLAAAADQTASTVAWDGSTITARANSTAYVVGNVYKVGTNAGRIFFCTVAGTSAAAEPAGLATALDGGAVADGTATFRAGIRQSLAVTFTPQEKGYFFAKVKVSKASYTLYVDPKATVT